MLGHLPSCYKSTHHVNNQSKHCILRLLGQNKNQEQHPPQCLLHHPSPSSIKCNISVMQCSPSTASKPTVITTSTAIHPIPSRNLCDKNGKNHPNFGKLYSHLASEEHASSTLYSSQLLGMLSTSRSTMKSPSNLYIEYLHKSMNYRIPAIIEAIITYKR